MVRRKLNESMTNSLKKLVEDFNNRSWDIDTKELASFYNYLYEDVSSVKHIYVPYNLTGYGAEFFDEVKFNDSSTHYFWNQGGVVGGDQNTKLLVEEVEFTNEALEEKIYCEEL